MDRSISHRGAFTSSCIRGLALVFGLALVAASTAAVASEPCGSGTYPFPYTDVASVTDPFCPGIMEAYVTGISKGTSPSTFSPNNDVTRVQMTTFLQRTVDQVLSRGSRRAALNQWWTTQDAAGLQKITLGGSPFYCVSDGFSIWVATQAAVVQVQANTGAVLGAWTGATNSYAVLSAIGRIFATGNTVPGSLYVIDPAQPPGPVSSAYSLGDGTTGIAYDGASIWTANNGTGSPNTGSVSLILPSGLTKTVSAGFNLPYGILYDGSHIWVTDFGANTLLKLDGSGNILQTVTVGSQPEFPTFDGANIWVPNFNSNSVTVVQASTGNIVTTIAADANNQLFLPSSASFDGERVLITTGVGSVTVFKAADLSFVVNVSTGPSTSPVGACSDGVNFWVTDFAGSLLRF